MNTKLQFTYKDVPYVLEYNRMAIKMLENQGLSLSQFSTQPMTMVELAFSGAFQKNHGKTSDGLRKEIYDHMKNKDALVNKLIEMISECYNSLLDDDEGNIDWSVASGK